MTETYDPVKNVATVASDNTTKGLHYDRAVELAKSVWGWHSPTVEVIKIAETTIRISEMRSGEYLVSEGLFSEEEIEKLLANKPRDEKTFEYLTRIEPRVASYVDRYKAAKANLPFYDLAHLRLHYVEETALIEELDSFDAVLAYLDHDDQMLMIFGSYDGLNRFRSQGRHYHLQKSKLYSQVFNLLPTKDPSLGLAQSLAVTQVIREMRATDQGEIGAGRQSNHWSVSGSANVLREERELARLIDYCLENDINDISLRPDANGSYQIGVRQHGDIITPEGFSYIEPGIADKMKRFLLTVSGANPTHSSRILTPRDGSITYSSS